MRQVWKYDVPVDDAVHEVRFPGGSYMPLLHVACQHTPDVVQAWFLVDDSLPVAGVRLQVFGTGHTIPGAAAWLGTTVTAGGALVWHLFDVGPRR